MNWRYALLWLALAVVAIANGVLRQVSYGRFLPELASHQVSTVTAILLSGLVARAGLRRWPPASAAQAWATGILWLMMTVAFEFGFGHFVAGHSWQRLLSDYDIVAGRIWIVFLAWILIMPYLFFRSNRTGNGLRN